jgi:hypothetical protein
LVIEIYWYMIYWMSIEDFIQKIKPRLSIIYYSLLALVVGSILVGFWRLSVVEDRHQPIRVLYPGSDEASTTLPVEDTALPSDGAAPAASGDVSQASAAVLSAQVPDQVEGGAVVGSKTGKKYYYPWCGGLKRVKPANRVPFASIEAARAAGYSPAGNCKGLK